jgi:hypothetical protein
VHYLRESTDNYLGNLSAIVGQAALPRAIVASILLGDAGEEWYGDGAPTWKQGRSNRQCMTAEEASYSRTKDVRRLRKFSEGDLALEALVDRLSACSPGCRCLSGACAECQRALQRLAVWLFAERAASLGKLRVMSVVDSESLLSLPEITERQNVFEILAMKLRSALDRAGASEAFGGFDVSCNEAPGSSPVFSPHAWIFIPSAEAEAVASALRETFA